MKKREIPIDAIIDRDLRKIIEELKLSESVAAGTLECAICGKVIGFDNIGALKVVDSVAAIICDDYICITEVTKK
jgi:hypothetical protein